MKTKRILVISLCALLTFCGYSQNGKPRKVGQEINKTIESSHPYPYSKSNNFEVVSTQRIFEKDASYIAVHFEKFHLIHGDYIVIRNPENTRFWKYSLDTERRKKFWSIPIYGQEAIIEIYSKNRRGGYGYKIDKIAKGYQYNPTNTSDSSKALCGSDNSKEAKCYQESEPFIYEKSRAVARLLLNGTGLCTGWLIGDDGHLMTNAHCVDNAMTASNVTVEFMAEGESCSTDCKIELGCAGTIEATSTTLVKFHSNLDYALLELPNNVSNQYGFLQLREEGATKGERIYIPQHPRTWGKRIAVESLNMHDIEGFASVYALNEPRCGGSGNDIGYYADTQGGSSGSPVLGYNDNLVVALHHCGSCPNRGVPIQEIINDLGNDLPNNAIGSSFVFNEKPRITVKLAPIRFNNVSVHMVGANGIDINSQSITSTTWQKVSSSGDCYSWFGGRNFEGFGYGICDSWSLDVEITATNSFGTTIIYSTITPSATGSYRIGKTSGDHTYRIMIDPSRSSSAFSFSNELNSKSIEKQEIWVYNLYGNLVFNTKETEFDLSFLRKGIYVIKASINGERITHKIVR
jgi:hypothetical protein